MIEIVFASFGVIAIFVFRCAPSMWAVAIVCVAGWLLLPVGNFPAGAAQAMFPYWITGTAVPSDMLLTKMWVPPVAALAGVVMTDRSAFCELRPRWLDLPMALWIVWPLLQWPLVEKPEPPPWIASLYLAAAWGVPWLLGRIYFTSLDGARCLLISLVWGLAVIAPIAVIEGIFGPRVYGWVYEQHPFRFDGQERYIGFRPLAFFEHGNQYGIWVAATAVAAIWLLRSNAFKGNRAWWIFFAFLALVVALASQSVGAIILLCVGLALTWSVDRPVIRQTLAVSILLVLVVGAFCMSGAIPLRSISENTMVGRKIVDVVRMSGRGSFTWRIARDQVALNTISRHPIVGTARWDWWRESGQRPWGLVLLLIGQFGLIGVSLALSSLLLPAARAFLDPSSNSQTLAIPLAVIVVIAICDAALNSFFFYPTILAAGGLAELKTRLSGKALDCGGEHDAMLSRAFEITDSNQ